MRSSNSERNAFVGILLAIAIFLQWNASYAATDSGDMAVLNEFYKNIDNKQILASWKGDDACGNWDHIQCKGGSVVGISMQGLGLQGQLPANLNQLKGLTTVSLQRNSLGGMLPSLSGLENLEVAYLNDNQFDGIPVDFFRDLKNLQGIYLSNNPLNKSTGWSLSNDLLGSLQLRNLSLTNTSLTGAFPSFIGNFSSLQEIRMAYNYLQGPLPGGLGATSLQVLVANNQQGDSQLNGTLDVLGNMTSLTQVWLHLNDFSGEIPGGLGNAAGLQQLLLNNNQLTGFVPASLASLENLQNVSVDNNLLDGPIPVMPKTVDFTYDGNYFCSSNAGAECAEEVNALLGFLRGVGFPPTVVKSWAGNDPCAGWYGVTCGANKKVSVVNLAKQGLVGNIDPSIGNLSSLTTLKLNDNKLTGTIPKSLTGLKALKVLDLSNNNLNGPIPTFSSSVVLKTDGNPYINTTVAPGASPPGNEGSLTPAGPGGNPTAGGSVNQKPSSKKVAGIIAGCVVLGIITLCGAFCLYRRKAHRFLRLPTELHNGGQVASNGAGSGEASSSLVASDGYVVYPLLVLQKATNNFNPENLLGKGGFGSVYEGKLENGLKVAVKRMDPQLVSNKGLQEFQAEINMLGKVRHRNLVALLGYCTESNERLLVYEFMPGGTLSQHLFDWQQNGLKPLDWKSRLLIALDVAHGIEYLHNLAYKIIIHRDLKPSNILLDESLRAKVSDFGLAKLAPEDKVSVETRLAGTFGYLAPEYAATGRVNTKSDVFSFGVVLMELITGQRALDERRSEDKIHLVPWFRQVSRDQEQLRTIIDPVLQIADEDLKSMNATVELAWHCTQREPHARPDMGYAVAVIGPMVREWKPSESVPEDTDFMGSGITAEQAFKRWKIFDDSSITIPGDRTDVGSSQQTGYANPGVVSAR